MVLGMTPAEASITVTTDPKGDSYGHPTLGIRKVAITNGHRRVTARILMSNVRHDDLGVTLAGERR